MKYVIMSLLIAVIVLLMYLLVNAARIPRETLLPTRPPPETEVIVQYRLIQGWGVQCQSDDVRNLILCQCKD